MNALFFELVLLTLAGCGAGIVTGLVPGIHINMVSALILASLPLFAGFEPISVAALIMAMSVTHTFLDFIPSILLGAPDADSAIAVLPGHRMLMQGRAIEAIKLTGVGSLFSLLIAAGLFLVLIANVERAYEFIKPHIQFILLFIVLLGFATEKKTFRAVFVFFIAGTFGYFVLSRAFDQGMIFPALSGMFGVSTLLLSLREEVHLPLQIKAKITVPFRALVKNSAIGAVAGMMVGLLPGIGPAQATYVTQKLNKNAGVKEFLVAVSGVNTANIIFTLVVLYSLGKMRSGITIVISDVLENMVLNDLFVFLGVILFAGGVALGLHLSIGSFMAKKLSGKTGASYGKISAAIITLIVISVIALTGLAGVFILVVGTAIGLLPPILGTRRAECMGFLLLPVMIFYFGLGALMPI